MHQGKIVLSFVVLFGALAGCSSSSSPGATAGGGDSGTSSTNATVAITSPAANATIALKSDKTSDIAFTTTNFTLKAPGSCAGASNCGHIHVLIDGTDCNDSANSLPYNIAATSSPAAANFGLCPQPDASHTVVLELHNDDHSPYNVNGAVVSASVKVTTTGP